VETVTERNPEAKITDLIEGEKVSLRGEVRQANRVPPGKVKGAVTKVAAHPHAAVVTRGAPSRLQERCEVERTVTPRGVKDRVDRLGEDEALNAGAGEVGDQEESDVTVVIGAPVSADHLSDDLGDARIMIAVAAAAVNQKQSITKEEDAKETI